MEQQASNPDEYEAQIPTTILSQLADSRVGYETQSPTKMRRRIF